VVAQYFYYDIYYKDFAKGKITLPGADEKKNNVSNNYFVMVKKSRSTLSAAADNKYNQIKSCGFIHAL
jgi:hypothetical protein